MAREIKAETINAGDLADISNESLEVIRRLLRWVDRGNADGLFKNCAGPVVSVNDAKYARAFIVKAETVLGEYDHQTL